MSLETDNFSFRCRFLCKSCKKSLISKEALDNHIINCYETRIEKLKENYIEQINIISKEYDEKYDKLIENFENYMDLIENRYINIINNLKDNLIKMAIL